MLAAIFGCMNCTKARSVLPIISRRYLSHSSRLENSLNDQRHKGHRVWVSTSHDVHHNLSLEDWIYNNYAINDDTGLLILWRNRPCIVIGRHQNPWLECDIPAALQRDVAIARRKSGGGTVYHDLGNLNITFVTSKKKYDRKRNLNLIADALRENWKLNVTVTERDDIILNNKYKVVQNKKIGNSSNKDMF